MMYISESPNRANGKDIVELPIGTRLHWNSSRLPVVLAFRFDL